MAEVKLSYLKATDVLRKFADVPDTLDVQQIMLVLSSVRAFKAVLQVPELRDFARS